MLTCGTGPEPVLPLPADHWVEQLRELLARTTGRVAALDSQDADQPMLKSIVDELAQAREAFEAIYSKEHGAAARYVQMVEAEERRIRSHESAVRLAVEEGKSLPTPGDGDLVRQILDGAKQARIDAWPPVEEAANAFIRAAQLAAGTRSELLRLKREPARIEAERVLEEIQAIDSRVAVARGRIDGASLKLAFEREGLLDVDHE